MKLNQGNCRVGIKRNAASLWRRVFQLRFATFAVECVSALLGEILYICGEIGVTKRYWCSALQMRCYWATANGGALKGTSPLLRRCFDRSIHPPTQADAE